ncbi:hypothetical protein ERJ75_000350400 [Trypanosoma vivax]|uniref:Uncharacterized protein n=1 Tax=Trypanosoma vivax (strain Y486) TaxID=1055687 RepID=G0TVC8_TRYVY|nr:hypothetical protein TRVL_01079 [Trypanosoma vivax]KAH8617626.1 hypothetical protein ERJ75_000350400 [Trypanosoma vivax]CCC47894.1 conserved hypothetical protein [Trypanosoma vivax Y486]
MRRKLKALSNQEEEDKEENVEIFGRFLYDSFKSINSSIFDLQLRHYADYLHHFGFSVERETRQSHEVFTEAMAMDVDHSEDDVVPSAGWGIGEAERKEADARAKEVGPLEGITSAETIVKQLVEPYMRVTWRQSLQQCSIKKARVLYRWLCENVDVDILDSPSADNVMPHNSPPAGKADMARNSSLRNKKGKTSLDCNPVIAMEEFIEPLQLALQERRANCHVMAQLYLRFLQIAGLSGEVVVGALRRRAPEDAIEWAWNIVQLPHNNDTPMQYLVDVALSVIAVPLRPVSSGKDAGEEVPVAKGIPKTESAHRKPKVPSMPEQRPKRGIFETPVLEPWGFTENRVTDFYFSTHPVKFFSTHFPTHVRHTLLMSRIRKSVWEAAPCLTHDFFRFPVALHSHKRHCSFTCRATPFYISLINEKPERTELCCVVFKGPLGDLPENSSSVTPLNPQWVWHQREEVNGCETFTITVPESGFYSVVIGAREIRKDPFSAFISDDAFVPIVCYQVLVMFVPYPQPVLPRQHFTPSICKLFEPLTYQVKEGVVRFVVMPSCANVAGVAVVMLNPGDGSRELVTFLNFSPASAAYTGDAELTSGREAEVWILYAAPDRDYMNVTDLRNTSRGRKRSSVSFFSDDHTGTDEQAKLRVEPSAACKSMFMPFVTSIEVKKMLHDPKRSLLIQPRPALDKEQRPMLRRLIGVTPELYKEATLVAVRNVQTTGSFFAKRQ